MRSQNNLTKFIESSLLDKARNYYLITPGLWTSDGLDDPECCQKVCSLVSGPINISNEIGGGLLPVVNTVGFASGELGLGEDQRTLTRALTSGGVEVGAIELIHPGTLNNSDRSIQEFIAQEARGCVNIFNLPPMEIYKLIYSERKGLFKGRYNIGYCPWELTDWQRDLLFCFDFLDEIWAPSSFIKNVYEKVLDIPVVHMPLIVEPFDFSKRGREYFGISKHGYVFGFSFDFYSSMHRKNPFTTVRTFKGAFTDNENVSLVIKICNVDKYHPDYHDFLSLVDGDSRIFLIEENLSKNDYYALLDCFDCFVSLHRSEGFGRCIAEAMLLEKLVIVTNFSGNIDFTDDSNSLLVDYSLVDVNMNEYYFSSGSQWADPSLDDAIAKMRFAYCERSESKILAETGRETIQNHFSRNMISNKYIGRVNEIFSNIV